MLNDRTGGEMVKDKAQSNEDKMIVSIIGDISKAI